jgi:heme exporter protein D
MSAFFAMGGYGAFVWPCYILAILLVVGLYWHSQKKLASSEKD